MNLLVDIEKNAGEKEMVNLLNQSIWNSRLQTNRKATFSPILYFCAAMQRTTNTNGSIATVLFIFCGPNKWNAPFSIVFFWYVTERQSKRMGETRIATCYISYPFKWNDTKLIKSSGFIKLCMATRGRKKESVNLRLYACNVWLVTVTVLCAPNRYGMWALLEFSHSAHVTKMMAERKAK